MGCFISLLWFYGYWTYSVDNGSVEGNRVCKNNIISYHNSSQFLKIILGNDARLFSWSLFLYSFASESFFLLNLSIFVRNQNVNELSLFVYPPRINSNFCLLTPLSMDFTKKNPFNWKLPLCDENDNLWAVAQ